MVFSSQVMGCPHFLPYPPRIENTGDDQHRHLDCLYPAGYGPLINDLIQQTQTFTAWHSSVRDLRAKIAIVRRIDRAAADNLGNVKPVGDGISELRVDVGAGYRVYFTMRSGVVIVLLAGGDKSSQRADIRRAKKSAKEI